MCVNKRYITNSLGKRILVSCGKCPACLQEKAILRTNRINGTYNSKLYNVFFVTFTYSNNFLPYVLYNELVDDYGNYLSRCNIYRDCSVRYVRQSGTYETAPKVIEERVVLSSVSLPMGKCKDKFVSVHYAADFNHISVCYYKDIQDCIKRIRINLSRNGYGKKDGYKPILFFSCNELGPSSLRSHFHVLFFVPKQIPKENFKNAVVKSWPYGDSERLKEYIIEPKDISSYLASYVNCDTSVPSLFKTYKEFKQKHSYSKMFGVSKDVLTLENLKELYFKRDLRINLSRMREGTLVVDSVLFPTYALHRYFPKYKGFSRFTSHQIYTTVLRPETIYEYSYEYYLKNVRPVSHRLFDKCLDDVKKFALSLEDCRKIEIMLRNKIKYAVQHGLSKYDYALIYSDIWSLRSSQVLKDSLLSVNSITQYLYAYDNIEDYFTGDVDAPTLDCLFDYINDNTKIVVDPNCMLPNINKHSKLLNAYYSYSKDRKIRNFIYSQNHYM